MEKAVRFVQSWFILKKKSRFAVWVWISRGDSHRGVNGQIKCVGLELKSRRGLVVCRCRCPDTVMRAITFNVWHASAPPSAWSFLATTARRTFYEHDDQKRFYDPQYQAASWILMLISCLSFCHSLSQLIFLLSLRPWRCLCLTKTFLYEISVSMEAWKPPDQWLQKFAALVVMTIIIITISGFLVFFFLLLFLLHVKEFMMKHLKETFIMNIRGYLHLHKAFHFNLNTHWACVPDVLWDMANSFGKN